MKHKRVCPEFTTRENGELVVTLVQREASGPQSAGPASPNVAVLSVEKDRCTLREADAAVRYRDQRLEPADGANGSTELSFSSDTPLNIFGEWEVLSHADGDADFSRLANVGAVLKNHDPAQIVGTPENVRLDPAQGKGRLALRWGSTQLALDAKREALIDKSLRGVSVGWRPVEWLYLKEGGEYKGRKYPAATWIAVKWQALEASLTPVPADWAVGVGRSQELPEQNGRGEMKKKVRFVTEWQSPDGTRHAAGTELEMDATVADGLISKGIAADAATPAPARSQEPAQPAQTQPAARQEPDIQAAIRAERERVNECNAILRKHGFAENENLRALIDKGASAAQVREAVLDAIVTRQQNAPRGTVSVTVDGRESFARAAEVGLRIRSGCKVEDAERRDISGQDICGYSLLRLAEECLRRAGMRVPGNPMEIARMALSGPAITSDMLGRHGETISSSTSDFPYILAAAANKEMLAGAGEVVLTYPYWCKIGSGSDFKAMSRLKLSEAGELPVVNESAGYTTTKFSEQREQISIVTYGKCFNLSRQMIINDDLDAFTGIPRAFGKAAAFKPEVLAVKVLCANGALSDGKALFHADHANLDAETDRKLDTVDHARAGIAYLWQMLGKQAAMKHADLSTEIGVYQNATMRVVLTPVTGHLNALAAVGSTSFGSGIEGINPLAAKRLLVLENALLENALVTGYSETAYYGFADPAMSPVIEVAFLNGVRTPFMEEVENTGTAADGRVMKVRLDAVAGAIDFRGAVKATGAD